MLAYKAFNEDLTCTMGKGRYQYYEGVVNRTNQANCIKNGFHCAENPLDCLTYYPDWDRSVYYLVEASGDIDEDASDSKISCTELRLLNRLSLFDFVMAAAEYMWRNPFRKLSCCNGKISVKMDRGKALSHGAVIVRGENPRAAGAKGSILALLKEDTDKRIVNASIRVVDGGTVKENTWYTI